MTKARAGIRRVRPWATLAGIIAMLLPSQLPAADDNVELQVKAAYVLHFAQYVYWPSSEASTPLVIAVLGADPMTSILEKAVRGKKVSTRPVLVKQFSSVEQMEHCDVLFVSRSASKSAIAALPSLGIRPQLTVSDKDGFARAGGMIEFVLVDDSVRFSINNEAVEKAGLKLNSELLRVAYAINGRRR